MIPSASARRRGSSMTIASLLALHTAAAAAAAPTSASPATPITIAANTVLKRLPADAEALTFRGENAQRTFELSLGRNEAARIGTLQVALTNAVSLLPERSGRQNRRQRNPADRPAGGLARQAHRELDPRAAGSARAGRQQHQGLGGPEATGWIARSTPPTSSGPPSTPRKPASWFRARRTPPFAGWTISRSSRSPRTGRPESMSWLPTTRRRQRSSGWPPSSQCWCVGPASSARWSTSVPIEGPAPASTS